MPPLLLLAKGRRVRARQAPNIRAKEISLHMAVADLLRRFARPDWRWSHFPAGEHRDVRTAYKLKCMGLQRGWPDFLLLSPDGGRLHALELKRFGEDLSDEQEAFAEWCAENAIPHAVARTVDEALGALSAWDCLKIGVAGQLRAHQKGAPA